MPQIDTRYGPLLVPDIEHDLIGRFLARYGEWAELEIEFVAGLVEDGAAVADIGACVGTFGIGLSQRKRLGRVAFVEANPAVIRSLRQNVERNCAAPAEVIEALVAPPCFAAAGWQKPGNIGATSFGDGEAAPSPALVPVALPDMRIPLAALAEQQGRFDLIKLDVEGMELPILRAAEALLRAQRPRLWLECNETPQSLDICDFLLDAGYQLYYYAFPAFNPQNFNKCREALLPFAYEGALLACQREVGLTPSLAERGCLLDRVRDREALRRALWRTPRGAPAEVNCEHVEEAFGLLLRHLRGEHYSQFLPVPGQGTVPPEGDALPVFDLREALAHAQHLALSRMKALERTETLLAARVELIRRVQQELADSETRLSRKESELDAAQERLRWSEAISDQRRLLLRAEQQFRLRLESELQARVKALPGGGGGQARAPSFRDGAIWRATLPLRRLTARVPLLHRGLKGIARRGRRGFRWMFARQ